MSEHGEEYFSIFLKKMGHSCNRREVPTSTLEKYESTFPSRLLTHWRNYGWSGYGNGIFWTVNPAEYAPIVEHWLQWSGIEQASSFHAIARGAFGDLYLLQEATGSRLNINPIHGMYMLNERCDSSTEESDISIQSFFLSKRRERSDFDDLFEKALKKLGPLQPDEMYGFVPAVALGGSADIEHLEKVKTIEHLTFLSQLAPLTDWGFPEL